MSLPLVPTPASLIARPGSFVITDGLGIVVNSRELDATVQIFIDDVHRDTGLILDRVATTDEPAITVEFGNDELDSIRATSGIRADGKPVTDSGDERYGLDITPSGVRVWATTVEGVHRGLTSLRQLIAVGSQSTPAIISSGTIIDGPRFAWRGLSLDVVRTFHDPETVRRVIDMCSLHKLNVLHLHLTDDQGWRIEVPTRPELVSIGSTGAIGDRPGGHYSLAEMAELVAYAAARFITVVPEIDMPGHTGAIFQTYPELAPANAKNVADGLAIGTLNPELSATWNFVEDVLDDVIPQFPQSAFVHIGGDEAFGMADEAHAAFVERVIELVQKRDRIPIGWQEIARAELDPNVVVQYWMDPRETEAMLSNDALQASVPPEMMPLVAATLNKSIGDLPRALDAGAKLVISPTSRLYFDRPHEENSSDSAQDDLRSRVGLPVYPPMSLRHGVCWDPADDTPGISSDDQLAGV